jgi:hypothetical protein
MNKTKLLTLGFMSLIYAGCAHTGMKSNDRMPAAIDTTGAITLISCSKDGESGIVIQTEVYRLGDGSYLIKQLVPHLNSVSENWRMPVPSTAKVDLSVHPSSFSYSDNRGTVVQFTIRGMGSAVTVQSSEYNINFQDQHGAQCFVVNKPANPAP